MFSFLSSIFRVCRTGRWKIRRKGAFSFYPLFLTNALKLLRESMLFSSLSLSSGDSIFTSYTLIRYVLSSVMLGAFHTLRNFKKELFTRTEHTHLNVGSYTLLHTRTTLRYMNTYKWTSKRIWKAGKVISLCEYLFLYHVMQH